RASEGSTTPPESEISTTSRVAPDEFGTGGPMTAPLRSASLCAMKVREVMRTARGIELDATLADAAEAIQASGCEAVPVVDRSNGEVAVRQLVALRDLPKLRRIE